MRITLLIAFLFSVLTLFGQEGETLQPNPKFVEGTVDDIKVDTTTGTAWITIGDDSLEFEFDTKLPQYRTSWSCISGIKSPILNNQINLSIM